MKTTTCSGIEVTEYDEADTLDLELEAPAVTDLAALWERLAEVYADGESCPACPYCESGWNPHTQRRWRECIALDPMHCPVINPRSIAAELRRQAS
jgi:hypothetical protein